MGGLICHNCDHAINLMLLDQGFTEPKAAGGWLADPKYKGWSADKIYDDLRRNPPPEGGAGEGSKPGKGAGSRAGRDWTHGDVMPSPAAGQDEGAIAAAEQRARQKVASAANMARMAGKFRGELERMVGELLSPAVPWTELLREYMLRVVKARENWNHRNRRFTNVYLPSRREKRMGPMVFIPDTSGSMWGEDLDKVCSEIAHCASQVQPENITVVWADTVVQGVDVFTPDEFEFAALKPKGGGGTDMRVPMKHVDQLEPSIVVLMTDGETPWPARTPDYPLIMICTTDAKVPFGEVIRI